MHFTRKKVLTDYILDHMWIISRLSEASHSRQQTTQNYKYDLYKF